MTLLMLTELPYASMAGLLPVVLGAAWYDWFYWRIPNSIVAAGATAALMLSLFTVNGIGFFSCVMGGLTGFCMLLPFYLLKGVAAGDVKLLSVVGMFTGPVLGFETALLSFLLGGVWAIGMLYLQSNSAQLLKQSFRFSQLSNISWSLPERAPAPVMHRTSRGSIPYGVVISMASMIILFIHLFYAR